MRRKGSEAHYFVQRIPADIRPLASGLILELPIGSETVALRIGPGTPAVRVSLRTSDKDQVRDRQAAVDRYVREVWARLRMGQPVPITHRQAVALAGEVYRAWANPEPGSETTIAIEHTPEGWKRVSLGYDEQPAIWEASGERVASVLRQADMAGELAAILEVTFGPLVDRLLIGKGIPATDYTSRDMILREVGRALREAFGRRQANAEGDYSPDADAARFPAWESPAGPEPPRRKAIVSLSAIVTAWWDEAKAAGLSTSTFENYRGTTRKLSAFLGHDDAARVTTANVIEFKDARLREGKSRKTVKDGDLAALKSLFKWAVDNGRLSTNPVVGVTVMRGRVAQRRTKSFTPDEAAAVLRHAKTYTASDREDPKFAAAKRWAPWLCAYTGARLGEIAQLRRRDVRQEGKLWVLTITPEAGTVKDKKPREVVLHSHLLEEGFGTFVEGSGPGPLFLRGKEGEDLRGRWRSLKNRLAAFVREVVADKGVAPNHAWRHLFKTIGREHGIEDRVLDAIQGHAPSSVGGAYGEVSLTAQARALARFPRYSL